MRARLPTILYHTRTYFKRTRSPGLASTGSSHLQECGRILQSQRYARILCNWMILKSLPSFLFFPVHHSRLLSLSPLIPTIRVLCLDYAAARCHKKFPLSLLSCPVTKPSFDRVNNYYRYVGIYIMHGSAVLN